MLIQTLAKMSRFFIQETTSAAPTRYNSAQLAHNPYEILPRGALIVDIDAKALVAAKHSSDHKISDKLLFGLHIEPFQGVDVVENAHVLPFRGESLDSIFCVSVLEYLLIRAR